MADSVVVEGEKTESLWRRRIRTPLLALLRQGATPEKLSLAIALGFVLGVFPVLGVTTLLCIAVVAALRLNQVAAQVGNGVSALFFIPLLIPFVRLGERVTGAEPFPLSVEQILKVAEHGTVVFLRTFSVAVLHGVLGWMLAAPVAVGALYLALLPLLRRARLSR